jgi:group I intron endonuclease
MIGIYKITSPSNKIYIGQSINIKKRWYEHKYSYKTKKSKLYSSFIKYGIENHVFEVIILCLIEDLNRLEKHYVDLFQSTNQKYGLNLKDGGGSKGAIAEETKKKISLALKGRIGKKLTEEQKKAQSIRQKGKVISQETKLKISLAKKGKTKTEETKQKMSLYSKNRSKSHLEKLSKSLTGKICSEESKQKNRLSSIGQKAWNKGISKYNFDIPNIIEKLKHQSCISISKEYGCNESNLRYFIKNNTGNTISYYKTNKRK